MVRVNHYRSDNSFSRDDRDHGFYTLQQYLHIVINPEASKHSHTTDSCDIQTVTTAVYSISWSIIS